MSLPSTASEQRREASSDAPERMQRLFAGLGVAFGLERSVKCGPGRWSTRRRLYSAAVEACGVERLARELPALLVELGMDDASREAFLAALQAPRQPHFLHLGVEESRCKVYWEAPLPRELGPGERFVLYRAWKWQPGETAALSDYVLVPTAGEARAAYRRQCEGMPMALVDLLEQLEVSFALAQTPWPPLTVRIEESRRGRATPRASLNLHLHQARLPLGGVAGLMMGLAREWDSAPRQALVAWIAAHGNEFLGNLSFGLGHDDEPFLTCYHGARVVEK
ncbi:hypothetical protein [Billgrantia lactosivorans]|uniref:hypothetical protein n=1 Tax=Billgrantia lactosivorans TaxID=2185141 RepID=UPI0013A6B489|nr:hypothetical protein [Halomonas lactosivorans]